MPQESKLWIALGGVLIGAAAVGILTTGQMQMAEKRASVAEGRALSAIESGTRHERTANAAIAKLVELDKELEIQRGDAEHWRKEAARWKIPPVPPVPPTDSPTAVAELHAVGLPSAQESPLGVALNLPDAGLVNRWGTERPVLLHKQIAQSALIEGLDLQVGTLTAQRGLLITATQEFAAGNKDLTVAVEQYRVAYKNTEKALTLERRLGKVRIGAAVVITYFVARSLK